MELVTFNEFFEGLPRKEGEISTVLCITCTVCDQFNKRIPWMHTKPLFVNKI